MLEGFGGLGTAGAGGQAIVVPGRVGAEVALARPHLVEATCVQFWEAHERMGLQRGVVLVPGWVWRSLLPFSHEEVLAQELELRVSAARGGRGIGFAKQVLGGDLEGSVAVGAKEEEHRVGRASRGRWALFFEEGLTWSHGSGRRLPAFLRASILLSGAWRPSDGVWREAGSLAAAGLISGGEHITLRLARRRLYARRRSSGGRQASTARMSTGVHAKQFVDHLWTLCQKAESFLVM